MENNVSVYEQKLIQHTGNNPIYPLFLQMCLSNPELLNQFYRLNGYVPAKTPLDAMIDESTGRDTAIMLEFMDFTADALERVAV